MRAPTGYAAQDTVWGGTMLLCQLSVRMIWRHQEVKNLQKTIVFSLFESHARLLRDGWDGEIGIFSKDFTLLPPCGSLCSIVGNYMQL